MMRLMNVFVPIVLLWNIINCMTNFSLTWAFQFPSSSSSITASKTTSSFLIQHKQKDNLLITSRFQSFPHQIQKRRTLLYNNQDDITTTSTTKTTTTKLDESQIDFIMGYMNKHHTNVLIKFTQVFTSLGEIQMKKNAFSGGSYEIVDAKLVGIYFDADTGACENNDNTESGNYLELEATVQIWGKKETTVEVVQVSLDAEPIQALQRQYPNHPPIQLNQASSSYSISKPIYPINQFIRKLNRLCNIIKESTTTGKLTQLAYQKGGNTKLILKENLYLNQVPHNGFVRDYFYTMASEAILDAVIACSDGVISNRMKMTVLFPEMNPQMDSYRIGTLLEIARAMTITLAEQNLRVRVCVQGSMGVGIFTGTPKALSGASTLLQRMDWQSNVGEANEGMVGNYVNFGAVGKEHVVNTSSSRNEDGTTSVEVEQDDVFLIICPQSMVGVDSSIIGPLSEMVDAAGDRPVILLNPDLVDKVSSQGQQNIRGRKERIEFAESFKTIFHFQNIYVSGTSYFPILGAVTKTSYDEPWIAYQRRDRVDNGGEIYIPVLSSEEQPDGESILKAFD